MDIKGNIVLKNNFWLISDFDDFGYAITKERPNYTFSDNVKGCVSLGLFFLFDKVFEPNKLMNENFEFILNKVERIDKNTYYAIDGVFIFKKYGIFKNGELIVPIEYSKKEVLQKIVK